VPGADAGAVVPISGEEPVLLPHPATTRGAGVDDVEDIAARVTQVAAKLQLACDTVFEHRHDQALHHVESAMRSVSTAVGLVLSDEQVACYSQAISDGMRIRVEIEHPPA